MAAGGAVTWKLDAGWRVAIDLRRAGTVDLSALTLIEHHGASQ